MPFTNLELQKCAAREAAMRKRVYAKHGKTSVNDFAEIEMMEAIAEHFKALAEPNPWDVVFEDKSDERVSRR